MGGGREGGPLFAVVAMPREGGRPSLCSGSHAAVETHISTTHTYRNG